ncbi:hypothetical protein PDIDSM_619 [Penicillium digitatum]|nr:hypothetical protein PDIDSM_619 [Penicillium digitatum]
MTEAKVVLPEDGVPGKHFLACVDGLGYRDSSKVASSDSTANLSPNTDRVLLAALLQQPQAEPAAYLRNNVQDEMWLHTNLLTLVLAEKTRVREII